MSNCSKQAARILDALARECRIVADEIARLGGQLSSRVMDGTAHMATFQSFDALSQQAGIQSVLITLMAQSAASDALEAAIAEIPLPAMRRRLLGALKGDAGE